MTDFIDTIVGVHHFLSDRAPRDIPLVDPKPRNVNPWRKDGKAAVARVTADGDIKASIERAISLLGDIEARISRGDRVFIKPNFNSPDPFPASTDLSFLHAVLEILAETGARTVMGESAGGVWRPTRKVLHKLGIYELARQLGVELIAFEDRKEDWIRVRVEGDYLSTVTVPRSAYEADRIVYLPCMKTHKLAGFSGALKLAMGFVHPGERRSFHIRHLEQKVAEISLCWQPDLIIMDGRKAFASGGPDKGEVVEPNLLLASGDPVAIDVEAMKTLLTYHARNKLASDPWQSPQVATALKHGLGADGYAVVTG